MGRRSGPVRKSPLPDYVSEFFDRHGKVRVRFRKAGQKPYYFKAAFPTKEFWLEYDACKAGATPLTPGRERLIPGSLAELFSNYAAKPSRLGPSPETQKKNRAILGEFVGKHGHRLVHDVRFEHLDAIFEAKAKDTPWQATKLRRECRKMFAFAKKRRQITENPVDDTDPIKAQARTNSKGFHSWTEAEIQRFEERHPIGSKAYLALMLLLWSFQRKGDVSALGPMPERPGYMWIAQEKSGGQRELSIRIGKPLADAIAAYKQPENWNGETYLSSQYGRRYAKESLGNWFRDRCNEAGLPHCSAHGLRKAASRRAAEANQSNQSIKAVTGHVKDDEIAYYTRAVEQEQLADKVIDAMELAEVKRLAMRANSAKKD